METRDNYVDFSALDAPEHLINVLHYFFQNDKYGYKYHLAKKRYQDLQTKQDFADSKRIFNVITGTNLVTNKTVTSYKTPQGSRYLIRKDYFQKVQRMTRTNQRSQQVTATHTSTSKVKERPRKDSPFLALKDVVDTSDEEEPKDDNDEVSKTPKSPELLPKATVTPKVQNKSPASADDEKSIDSTLTQHTAELERNMDKAYKDLHNTEIGTEEQSQDDYMTELIKTITRSEINPFMKRLEMREENLKEQTANCMKLSNELKTLITSTKAIQERMSLQQEKLTGQISFIQRKATECEMSIKEIQTSRDDLIEQVISKIQPQLDRVSSSTSVKNEDIMDIEAKFKRRFNRFKDATTKMFDQQENDNDMMHDRILRIEEDFKKIQGHLKIRPTPKSLFFGDSTDDTDYKPDKTISHNNPTVTPTRSYGYTGYNRGPNMEYLRKNVHITCSDQEQILEFYIKLRLSIEKGGIHIIPIKNITKNASIADINSSMSDNDMLTQSNALFTLLSNENIIPNDFVMAQNCLLGCASTMDGFGALKAMLKLTHPTLTNKRPPSIAPILSQSEDIHSYEQSLKNFYLLHKLYNATEFTPLEKAKQFIHGIDDEQYTEAVSRIRYQLDTVQTLDIDLHDDYTIENITSTIINITSEYDNAKTIVRTMRYGNNNNTNRNYNQKQYQDKKISGQSQRQVQSYQQKRKFTKAQCHACKQFGHIVTHCTLLPKVLAILQFSKKHPENCDNLLKQHIQNNSVDAKKTFVRTLQGLSILPQDDDSDHYLENDVIINTMIDNAIKPEDILSQDE